MPEDTTNDLNARRSKDVRDIAAQLTKLGVNPDTSKELAEVARDRLFYGHPRAPTRILKPGTLGEFLPGDYENPLGALVNELFSGTSDEYKLEAVKAREEQVNAIVEEKRSSSNYHNI